MSRVSEHSLDLYGTEGVMPDQPTPGIEALAQRIPPDSDPDAQLQWAIEMMGYTYMYGSEALKRGAVYRPSHPQYESAPGIYIHFLTKVVATEQRRAREAAE